MKYEDLMELSGMSFGRDHITTKEFAKLTCRAEQTIRKNACLKGNCFGIVPLKFGNRLLWPIKEVVELLTNK